MKATEFLDATADEQLIQVVAGIQRSLQHLAQLIKLDLAHAYRNEALLEWMMHTLDGNVPLSSRWMWEFDARRKFYQDQVEILINWVPAIQIVGVAEFREFQEAYAIAERALEEANSNFIRAFNERDQDMARRALREYREAKARAWKIARESWLKDYLADQTKFIEALSVSELLEVTLLERPPKKGR